MYRSHKIYLTIGLLLATCLAGCRDSLRSKRQRILDAFSHVSLASENERMSASRYCEEACTGIGMLGECERKEMLGILADRFLDIRFDEKSYGNRIVSIDAYVALVRMSFEALMKSVPLSDADIQVFRKVFFNYFRFQEYASLFLNPEMTTADKLALTEKQILEDSGVLFYYGSAGTRVDSFFYALEHPATIYKFPNNNKGEVKGGFVRFWDMFLSWASQLELVERLNMKRQGYTLSNDKFFSAAYFINPVCNVDVQAVLDRAFYRQLLIDISDLVMEICLAFRCSISTAQQAIIDYYQSQPDRVSLIRTSEIFIKETELNKNDRILYPKYKGSFVSHIKLRKNG